MKLSNMVLAVAASAVAVVGDIDLHVRTGAAGYHARGFAARLGHVQNNQNNPKSQFCQNCQNAVQTLQQSGDCAAAAPKACANAGNQNRPFISVCEDNAAQICEGVNDGEQQNQICNAIPAFFCQQDQFCNLCQNVAQNLDQNNPTRAQCEEAAPKQCENQANQGQNGGDPLFIPVCKAAASSICAGIEDGEQGQQICQNLPGNPMYCQQQNDGDRNQGNGNHNGNQGNGNHGNGNHGNGNGGNGNGPQYCNLCENVAQDLQNDLQNDPQASCKEIAPKVCASQEGQAPAFGPLCHKATPKICAGLKKFEQPQAICQAIPSMNCQWW